MKVQVLVFLVLYYMTSLVHAVEDSLPFDLDLSRIESKSPFRLYANLRSIYGEGIEAVNEGRLRQGNQQLRLGFRYHQHFTDSWYVRADARGVFLHRHDQNNVVHDELWNAHFEVRELYLQKQNLLEDINFGVLAGRKQFRDNRGWWYDNLLDVVQLQYNSTLLNVDFSYGGRIIDERVVSEIQNIGFEDSEFFIGHLDFQYYYQQHFEIFTIYQHDDFSDYHIGQAFDRQNIIRPELDLMWAGFRFNGLFSLSDRSRLSYWYDFATIYGSKRDFITSNISASDKVISQISDQSMSPGFGMDVGLAWKAADESWGLSINYAYGSGGDNPFEQPEISLNNGNVFNEYRYRIYGDLVRPELSNFQLLGLSAGVKINPYLWIQGNYFHYRQVQADTQLIASPLLSTPNGRDTEIGDELDIAFVTSVLKDSQIILTLSGFKAGDAFDGVAHSKLAYKGLLELRLFW